MPRRRGKAGSEGNAGSPVGRTMPGPSAQAGFAARDAASVFAAAKQ
jgi:hypothetical protein